MNLHPDDPKLTTCLLGELPPDEAAEIERAAAANPALKVALDDLARMQRLLGDTLGGEATERLHPWQRDAIRRTAADADAAEKIVELPSRGRSWRPLLVVAASVALVAGATWVMWRLPVGPGSPKPATADVRTDATPAPDWDDPAVELALLPLPGPEGGPKTGTSVGSGGGDARTEKLARSQEAALRDDPGGFMRRIGKTLRDTPLPPPERLKAWPERQPIDAAAFPALRLPLIAGDFSYGWIREALLGDRKPPPPGAVRIGELVNHFPATFAAKTKAEGVRISAESIRCPWDDKSLLTLICLETDHGETRRVSLEFSCDPKKIGRYRLLGFDRAATSTSMARPADTAGTLLPGGHRVALVVQSWPKSPDATATGIAVSASIGGEASAKEIRIDATPAVPWNQASPQARLAALASGFGLWLRKSEVAPAPDLEQLAKLAAELAKGEPENRKARELLEVAEAAKGMER